jgi:hypothetical protein
MKLIKLKFLCIKKKKDEEKCKVKSHWPDIISWFDYTKNKKKQG